MDIKTYHLIEGAKEAEGLVVIIDVFRAFTTACYLVNQGATKILPKMNIEDVWKAKEHYIDAITVGERMGNKIEGFDYGNSPYRLQGIDFSDKVVIQTTSAGTKGLLNATEADIVITGSFVNAGAICRYIEKMKPKKISLVAMGYEGENITMEDEYLAEYLTRNIEGGSYSLAGKFELLKRGDGARFFNESTQEWSPKEDFDLCLDTDQFDFVLKLENDENGVYLKRIDC